MRKCLIKENVNDNCVETNNYGKKYGKTETKNSGNESTENQPPFESDVMKGKSFGRQVKISFLNADKKKSLSKLSISDEYSVVFCFPVSFRFTTEDLNLLETYLQYRQREDHSRVTIAFTYSERLKGSCEPEAYIKNLPKKLKEYIQEFECNYIFVSSREQNMFNAIRLIKPFSSVEYRRKCVNAAIIFVCLLLVL